MIKRILCVLLIVLVSMSFLACSQKTIKSETSLEDFIAPENMTTDNMETEDNVLNNVNGDLSKLPGPVTPDTETTTKSEELKLPEIVINETVIEPIIYKVNLKAVGDNLIHTGLIKAGKQNDGSYNFDSMYSNILKLLENTDIKVMNQETMLINDESEYSGYPTFGSPMGIGEAVYNAGFNIVTAATNHSYDKKIQGITDTINFFKDKENVTLLGLHESEEDYNTITVKEFNNISFAMLNYTYGLNGFVLPKDKPYLVDTFMNDASRMLSQVEEAKELADFTIVFLHMGTEYTNTQTKAQEEMFTRLAEAGADIIIGTHPHVVEPVQLIETSDGRQVVAYYSLGNFISSQDRLNTMLGAMADVTFVKEDDNCYIEKFDMIPLVTHINSSPRHYTTYLLEDYTEELAKAHRLFSQGLTMDYLNNLWNSIIENSNIKK